MLHWLIVSTEDGVLSQRLRCDQEGPASQPSEVSRRRVASDCSRPQTLAVQMRELSVKSIKLHPVAAFLEAVEVDHGYLVDPCWPIVGGSFLVASFVWFGSEGCSVSCSPKHCRYLFQRKLSNRATRAFQMSTKGARLSLRHSSPHVE